MLRKTLTAAVLLAILGAGAVPSQAWDHHDKCERDIHKAEQNLDKAIRKHGERSRQAEEKRHQLEEARARCHDRH